MDYIYTYISIFCVYTYIFEASQYCYTHMYLYKLLGIHCVIVLLLYPL